MIFFRVTQNINIKTTDGTLVKYFKLKGPSNLNNETAYITTADDFEDLKEVFHNVDKDKYKARLLKEEKVRQLEDFPIELGISNVNEYINQVNYEQRIENSFINDEDAVNAFLFSNKKANLYQQLKKNKKSINVAIIGSVGRSIGEMVASSTALRIFYDKLKELFEEVKLDIYINASNNSFFSRDKEIFQKQEFINKVYPLSINVKKFCTYDYFVDTSSVDLKSMYFNELNLIDAWLYKFGIDYFKVPNSMKYNHLNMDNFNANDKLKERLDTAKTKGKLLLFHPYSAKLEKSIPQEFAVAILKKLIKKAEDYTIVTTLNIDGKNRDNVIDFSKESKSFNDFAYIISNMDAIITAETSTYHISDAFMIPTVVLFNNSDIDRKIKYYNYVKAVEIEDKSKNFSQFIFQSDELTFYKFESWEKLKISRIIKLLETF